MSTRRTPNPAVQDQERDDGVLLAVGSEPPSAVARRLAVSVAREPDSTLHVVSPFDVPRYTPLDVPQSTFADNHAAVRNTVETIGTVASGTVRVGHDQSSILAGAADERGVGSIVVDGALVEGDRVPPTVLDDLSTRSECDVVATRGDLPGRDPSTVLVAVAGGPHSGLAVEVSLALARENDAWVDLLHVVDTDEAERHATAEEILETQLERFGGCDRVSTWTLESDDVSGTIREQSRYYRLTVIGAPRSGRLRRLVFGSTAMALESEVRSPVAVVRRAPTEGGGVERG